MDASRRAAASLVFFCGMTMDLLGEGVGSVSAAVHVLVGVAVVGFAVALDLVVVVLAVVRVAVVDILVDGLPLAGAALAQVAAGHLVERRVGLVAAVAVGGVVGVGLVVVGDAARLTLRRGMPREVRLASEVCGAAAPLAHGDGLRHRHLVLLLV